MTAKVIDLPVERIRALKDEAVARAKAAGMRDEGLNARAFALQDVLTIKERRERGAGPKPSDYTASILRDVTKTEGKVRGCTVRRWYEQGAFIGADVYSPGGLRVARVKTERGIASAVERALR